MGRTEGWRRAEGPHSGARSGRGYELYGCGGGSEVARPRSHHEVEELAKRRDGEAGKPSGFGIEVVVGMRDHVQERLEIDWLLGYG